MFYRKLILPILFFLVSFFGTGIYFFVGNYMIKAMACAKNRNQVLSSNQVVILQIPLKEYESLEQEKADRNVFEISYKGIQYDVYSWYTKNNIVYLSAVADKQEMSLLNSLKNLFNENDQKGSKQTLATFFSFYFFESFDKISFVISKTNKPVFSPNSPSPNSGFMTKDFSPPRI